MARTGLRMMPTFPSPPLEFRTVGFPQYGFKASLSGGAFLDDSPFKPAPGIRGSASSLRHPSHASAVARSYRGSGSAFVHASACRCARRLPFSTPGVLGSGPSSVVSVHLRLLRPHPPVSRAHRDFAARRLIRDAFAVRERRGDPRDLPYFRCRALPRMPPTLRRWVRPAVPFLLQGDTRLPRLINESPPTTPASASNSRRGLYFDAASFASSYGPRVCQALQTGYDDVVSRAHRLAF